MRVFEIMTKLNQIERMLEKVNMVLLKEAENEEYLEKKRLLDEEHNKYINMLIEMLPHLENDENLKLR